MSRGLICDNCSAALPVNHNGEDEYGESAGWVTIGTTYLRFDACTISCAEALLAGPIKAASESALEAVAAVVRALREEEERKEGEEYDGD